MFICLIVKQMDYTADSSGKYYNDFSFISLVDHLLW